MAFQSLTLNTKIERALQQHSGWFKAALFVLGLLPLARLIVLAMTDGLGANPIEAITRSTGEWTLIALVLTLSVTPLRRLVGIPSLLRLRRMLGLFCFFYACLHFTTYIWFDQFFDVNEIIKDIAKRPFITVGFAAFVLLIPLALTSNNAIIRRMGVRNWQRLHRAIYAIAILAVIHYWWLVKKDLTEPITYAIIIAILLAYRVFGRKTTPMRGAASKPDLTVTRRDSTIPTSAHDA